MFKNFLGKIFLEILMLVHSMFKGMVHSSALCPCMIVLQSKVLH